MGQEREDLARFKTLLESLLKAMGFTNDLIMAMLNKFPDYHQQDGLESLMKHMHSGGKCEHINVDMLYKDEFAARLQKAHIPFFAMDCVLEDGTKKAVFMFKDKDKSIVKSIKDNFGLDISNNSKEITIGAFREAMKDREVGIADGLSLEQLHAFRANVKDTDIKFCVAGSQEAGKYMIYASDKDKMTDVLIRTSYDIANDSQGYADKVHNYKNSRNALFDKIGKEEFVICDRDNPNNFMLIREKDFSMHSYQLERELQPDGSMRSVIMDKTKSGLEKIDRNTIFNRASQYKHPVAVSLKDFNILDKVNKDGVAFSGIHDADVFADRVEALQHNLEHEPDVICRYPKRKPRFARSEIEGYVNLTRSQIIELTGKFDYIVAGKDNSIAFPKERKAEIDAYMAENFLADLSPVQKRAFEMMITGRTGRNLPVLSRQNTQDFYILDADRPSNIVRVEPEGVHAWGADGAEVFKSFEEAPEQVDEFLATYADSGYLKNPVILSAEEMESPDKNKLIHDRANLFIDNEAVERMADIDEIEKQELVENKDNLDEVDKSKEQDRGVKEVNKLVISSMVVDHSVFFDMEDLAANKVMRRDEEISL